MRILLSLLLCGVASGQPFKIGAKFGVPITNSFSAGISGGHAYQDFYTSKTRRYIFGPTITVQMPHQFALEVDALYRRLNYDSYSYVFVSAGDGGSIYQWSATAGNRFELPILLRCGLKSGAYAVAGPTLAIHSGFSQRIHTIQDLVIAGHSDTLQTRSTPEELDSRVASGLTFGLGYDAHSERFHVKPELRYTVWLSQAFQNSPGLSVPRHELQVFLSFEFGGR